MLRAQQIAAVLSFLFMVASGTVAADSQGTIFATPSQDPTSQGFIVPLPEIEPSDLVNALHEARSRFEASRSHYQEVAEDTEMTAGKFLFALIAPGGFLLAAGSELIHNRAEQKMASLEVTIQELGGDLKTFEGIARDRRIILASYR